MLIAPGVGGFDPFTTTPLLFLHFRLIKNDSAATRRTRPNVPATLMPAIAPFERPGESLGFPEVEVLIGIDIKLELIVEGLNVELPLEVLVVDVNADLKVDVDDDDVGEVEIEVDVDVDSVVVSKGAAISVLLDSSAATKLLVEQPSSLSQASLKQQPRKGASKPEQVYQLPFPEQA